MNEVLVGRSAERGALRDLLARGAEGLSGALVLRGEAGAGKTALLDETVAAATAAGMQTVRLTAVEAETQLGYAGLHRFLLPFADHLERLPGPQRDALRSTFGLVTGPSSDRFLIALGVLTVLADAASQAPLLCMVDDVQWLDSESAMVLGFVARRLHADRVVLLFAVREPAGQLSALAGLPQLMIGGLDDQAAIELLTSLTPGRLSPAIAARIAAETGGNPLALVELSKELSPAQLAGSQVLPEPLHVGGLLERVFSRRLSRLPPDARLLLAVAAAEPTGSQALLWRAARELGIDPDTAAPADLSDLAEFTAQEVVFRQPLIRSAAYYGIPLRERQQIHHVLAAANDGERPDRVAWHLGIAAADPDEAVAARLEQAAETVRARGGDATAVTFLSRAADLSTEEGPRTRRLLAASEAALNAGQPVRASALLDEAMPRLGDPLARSRAQHFQGRILLALAEMSEASSILLEAARALAPTRPREARQALLEALEAVLCTGWSASRAVLPEIAQAVRATPAAGRQASATDLLLDGFAAWAAAGYTASVPQLRRAIALLCAGDLSADEGLRGYWLGCVAAAGLFDDQAQHALTVRLVQLAREEGAPAALAVALCMQGALAEVTAGRFDAARGCFTEAAGIAAATRNPRVAGKADVAELFELAWRGRETDARRVAAAVTREAVGVGHNPHRSWAQSCLAVLELSLGNNRAALRCALDAYQDDAPFLGGQTTADLVEAAARCSETGLADAALGRLAQQAPAAGTPLALGLLARSRALLAADGDAERLYREAIEHLKACRSAPQLARAHLVYGEWLRRQRRRREARGQLRTAHEMFGSMGAEAFAERVRIELLATGEQARPRTLEAGDELTPQEAQIASLVSKGDSNRDVAAQLFLSPATVDYHLRKVYRKLGVASRTQLTHAMVASGSPK